MEPISTGGCLCGAVRYSVDGPLRDIIICHCVFCRRTTTHIGAYSACAPNDLHLAPTRTLAWFRSSPTVQRGFCRKCGSQLFWKPSHGQHISISGGSLDSAEGLRVAEEIFVEQRPSSMP